MSVRPRDIARCALVAALLVAIAVPAMAQGQGRATGQVLDEDGNPMAGVKVTAENPTANPPIFESETDSNGRFAILGMVSGQWNFTAEIDGYQPSSRPRPITQTRNAPFDLTLVRIRHPLEVALGETALEGLDPEAIDAELTAADAAFNAQQWGDAIAGYQSVLAQLPQLSTLHVQIGNAYAQQSQPQEAIASYERALVDDPDNRDAQSGIAHAKLAMGDLEAASEGLAQAASRLNASREDFYNLGEIEFARGDVDTAAGWYEKATMADPKWGKPLFKLALVALNKGDIETAKKYFQQVVDVDPNSEEGAQAQATLSALP